MRISALIIFLATGLYGQTVCIASQSGATDIGKKNILLLRNQLANSMTVVGAGCDIAIVLQDAPAGAKIPLLGKCYMPAESWPNCKTAGPDVGLRRISMGKDYIILTVLKDRRVIYRDIEEYRWLWNPTKPVIREMAQRLKQRLVEHEVSARVNHVAVESLSQRTEEPATPTTQIFRNKYGQTGTLNWGQNKIEYAGDLPVEQAARGFFDWVWGKKYHCEGGKLVPNGSIHQLPFRNLNGDMTIVEVGGESVEYRGNLSVDTSVVPFFQAVRLFYLCQDAEQQKTAGK